MSEIKLARYARATTSYTVREAEARPAMTANKTTPGTIIPISAKLSIKEAPIIPKAIH